MEGEGRGQAGARPARLNGDSERAPSNEGSHSKSTQIRNRFCFGDDAMNEIFPASAVSSMMNVYLSNICMCQSCI